MDEIALYKIFEDKLTEITREIEKYSNQYVLYSGCFDFSTGELITDFTKIDKNNINFSEVVRSSFYNYGEAMKLKVTLDTLILVFPYPPERKEQVENFYNMISKIQSTAETFLNALLKNNEEQIEHYKKIVEYNTKMKEILDKDILHRIYKFFAQIIKRIFCQNKDKNEDRKDV